MHSLEQNFEFLAEIDQLKAVERQTLNIDGKRRENTAEHCWSLAMATIIFKAYAANGVNIEHATKLALAHDLVEIYAGDVFVYHVEKMKEKEEKERESAKKLFKLDSKESYQEYYEYWIEYEEQKTPESIYVNALDRLLPIFFNTQTNGHSWQKHGVTAEMVLERNSVIKRASEELWQYTLKLVEQSVEKGYLK